MEVAVIDWKNLDSKFVKDDLLENINAPQWIDFSAPDDSVNDEAWFCRPDCNHPKTVDDFYKGGATPTSKLQRSATVSENLLVRERIRRGKAVQTRVYEETENQNPNLRTPPRFKAKLMKKDEIKSSAEKEKTPKLRSTQSARNLFSGMDLLNKVTEFCNELKKLTTRATEKQKIEEPKDDLAAKEKEKTPLLDTPGKNILKEKQRNKQRNENAENTPIITIDVKNTKRGLSQIRTCPPTPQSFSESRGGPTAKATPPRTLSSRPWERGVLQELGKNSKEKSGNRINNGQASMVTENEARGGGLDVFWFLKPCTLST